MTPKRPTATFIPTALGMLWLALFPLWQDGSFSRITASKQMGMTILTILTALAALRLLPGMFRKDAPRPRLGSIQVLALTYFLLVAGSAVFGSMAGSLNDAGQRTVLHGARRYEGLYTQLCYAVIFLTMSLRPPKIRPVLNAAGDVLLVMCIVVCLQYFGVNVLGLYPAGRSIRTNYEFQGTIGNIDMVSGYVSLTMPALLAGYVTSRQGGRLWLLSGMAGTLLMLCMEVQSGLIVVGVTLVCLALWSLHAPAARARAGTVIALTLFLVTLRSLIGLPWLDGTENLVFPHAFSMRKLLPALVGLACLPLTGYLKRHPGKPLRLRAIVCLLAALVLAGLAAVYFAPLPAGGGLWELQELLHGRPQDAFGSERIGIWRLTLEMSRRDLLFGTGPDTFLYAMDAYMLETGQDLVQRFDNPHNMLLAILANNGLPAMLAFVALCAAALWAGLNRALHGANTAPFLLGCLCYLVQGMFTFSICLVTPMFFCLLGMLTAQINETSPERKRTENDPQF